MNTDPQSSPDDNRFQSRQEGDLPEGKPGNRRQAVADERALKTWEYRIKEGLTYKQIGEKLGITAGAAKAAYDRGRIMLIPKEDVEVAKEIALQKLDIWEQMMIDVYQRKHKLVVMGKLIEGGEDFGPKVQAMDRILKIEAMRTKILGYAAPSKRVLEVISEDKFDEAIRALNEQAAELERQAVTQTQDLAEEILAAAEEKNDG